MAGFRFKIEEKDLLVNIVKTAVAPVLTSRRTQCLKEGRRSAACRRREKDRRYCEKHSR